MATQFKTTSTATRILYIRLILIYGVKQSASKLQNNITHAETKAKTLMSTFGGGMQPCATHLSTNAQKRSMNPRQTRNKTPSQNRKICSFVSKPEKYTVFKKKTRLSVIKIAGNSMRNCWQPHFRTAGLNGHTS